MNAEITKGDKFYIVFNGEKNLRTITYASGNIFEWNFGWSTTDKLVVNPNINSKVKYTINY
jgi:hypothetical protein